MTSHLLYDLHIPKYNYQALIDCACIINTLKIEEMATILQMTKYISLKA